MTKAYTRLHLVPLSLREANAVVGSIHRHHPPVRGQRFSFGVIDDDGKIRGVCIVGRPVSRSDPRRVAEVTRVATDGTANACSMLYGAAARACQAMGFESIQTYILHDDEPGTSLKAAGWEFEAIANRATWGLYRHRTNSPDDGLRKGRWSRHLNPPRPDTRLESANDDTLSLWGEEPAA